MREVARWRQKIGGDELLYLMIEGRSGVMKMGIRGSHYPPRRKLGGGGDDDGDGVGGDDYLLKDDSIVDC